MLEIQGVSNTITGASEMQLETTMKSPETQNSFCAFISTLADWVEGPVEKIRFLMVMGPMVSGENSVGNGVDVMCCGHRASFAIGPLTLAWYRGQASMRSGVL